MTATGRVRFPKSPWPSGHALKELTWTGRLEPDRGLFFDLHCVTEPYTDAGDPAFDDDDSDWRSVGCWSNYGRCTLSSTAWGGEGVWVADEDDPLDLERLGDWTFEVDSSTRVNSDKAHAFGIYLMGHDTVLRHQLHFTRADGRAFALRWTAKIALTYAGQDRLCHSLELEAPSVAFEGFSLPEGLGQADARDALARFVTDPSKYQLRRGVFRPKH